MSLPLMQTIPLRGVCVQSRGRVLIKVQVPKFKRLLGATSVCCYTISVMNRLSHILKRMTGVVNGPGPEAITEDLTTTLTNYPSEQYVTFAYITSGSPQPGMAEAVRKKLESALQAAGWTSSTPGITGIDSRK